MPTPLPDRAERILRSAPNGYADGISKIQSLAHYAAHAGMDSEGFERTVTASAFWTGFHTSKPQHKRLGAIQDAWYTATRDADESEEFDVRQALVDLRGRVASHNWTGRTAITDKDVALTMIDRGIEVGSYTVGWGSMRIAEHSATGMSDWTVRAARRRLAKIGLIGSRPRGDGARSALDSRRFVLNVRWHTHAHVPSTGVFRKKITVEVMCVPEAFLRGKGLGLAAFEVWTVLSEDQGREVADIAKDLGKKPNAVRNTLARMEDRAIVVRTEGKPARYLMAPDVDLNVVAAADGKTGRRERQRAAYDQRRADRVAVWDPDRRASGDQWQTGHVNPELTKQQPATTLANPFDTDTQEGS